MTFLYNYFYELPDDIINIITKYANMLYKDFCAYKIQHLYYRFIHKKVLAIELALNIETFTTYGFDYNNSNYYSVTYDYNNFNNYHQQIKYIDVTNEHNTNVLKYCDKVLTGKEDQLWWTSFLNRANNGITMESAYHCIRLKELSIDNINDKIECCNKLKNAKEIVKKIDNYQYNYKYVKNLSEKFYNNSYYDLSYTNEYTDYFDLSYSN